MFNDIPLCKKCLRFVELTSNNTSCIISEKLKEDGSCTSFVIKHVGQTAITKIKEFAAAHFLPFHKGKCKNMHGHTYKLEIEISAPINANGIIMDFGDLDKIITEMIDNNLDHILLNDSFTTLPTAENMVNEISLYLLTKVNVVRVRLWETSTAYAEWRKR